MLRWSFGHSDGAARVESAVRQTLSDGIRTGDLMGSGAGTLTRVGTAGFRDAVLERVGAVVGGMSDQGRDEGAGLERPVVLYDTTLRDGTQGENITLSLADKLRIARMLDEYGMPYIEGGWPGSNPKDIEFFAAARTMTWRTAKLAAFGSTRHRANRPDTTPICGSWWPPRPPS